MERVRIINFADNKLQDLADILYVNEYFGFRADAKAYVEKIYQFIYTIPTLKHRQTKTNKHGAYYCRYKPNRNTTWYITFDIEGDFYLVKNIINNHSKDYPRFIASL